MRALDSLILQLQYMTSFFIDADLKAKEHGSNMFAKVHIHSSPPPPSSALDLCTANLWENTEDDQMTPCA